MDEQKKQKYIKAPINIQQLYASPESGALMSQIYKKYQLPPEKYLLYSNTIGDVILGIYTSDQLPERLKTELAIDETTANAIADDLKDFLKPVYDRENGLLPEAVENTELEIGEEEIAAPTVDTSIKYQPTAEAAKETTAPTNNQTDSPRPTPPKETRITSTNSTDTPTETKTSPHEAPSDANTITAMHTMADDIEKIQGYGAYRDKFPAADSDDNTPTHQSSSQEDLLNPTKPKLADTPDIDKSE